MITRRPRGVLRIDRYEVPGVLVRAKTMAKGLLDSAALFPAPSPALAVFDDQIDKTELAQLAVGEGGRGKAALRAVEVGLLVAMMKAELFYIQSVADAAPPDKAAGILLAGGVAIAEVGRHEKAILGAIPGPTPGSVQLTANATALLGDFFYRKHYFCWEYTLDGSTFTALTPTPGANTVASGLPPLTTLGFRVAVSVAKQPPGPWSHVVSCVVL